MSKTIYIIFVVFSILTIGCNGGKEKEVPSNIVVLLDISDRISAKEYPVSGSTDINNDISNCQFIIKYLQEILDAKGYKFEHRLQFIVVNQPQFRFKTRYSNDDMAFNKRRIETYHEFDEIKDYISETLHQLYLEAHNYDKSTLTGSDIWEWFKESSKSYILPEYKNYIICLTDGYLDFNNDVKDIRPPGTYMTLDDNIRRSKNWRELLKTDNTYKLKTPAGVDFSDYKYEVQFLIVGIKDRTQEIGIKDRTQEIGIKDRTQKPTEPPKETVDKDKVIIADKDILRGMWTIWLESMGIKPYGFVSADVNQEDQIIIFLSSTSKSKAVASDD